MNFMYTSILISCPIVPLVGVGAGAPNSPPVGAEAGEMAPPNLKPMDGAGFIRIIV